MKRRNPKSSLTKKDLSFWISGITGDYFIKKIAPGKYRVSADRAHTLRRLHETLGARFKTTSAPSVVDMWFIVESKPRLNPYRRKRHGAYRSKFVRKSRRNCGCKRGRK